MVTGSVEQKSAVRIVEIQKLLPEAQNLEAVQSLLDEQRALWDADYRGCSFDEIRRDVWFYRS